jgi:hypothetical protein
MTSTVTATDGVVTVSSTVLELLGGAELPLWATASEDDKRTILSTAIGALLSFEVKANEAAALAAAAIAAKDAESAAAIAAAIAAKDAAIAAKDAESAAAIAAKDAESARLRRIAAAVIAAKDAVIAAKDTESAAAIAAKDAVIAESAAKDLAAFAADAKSLFADAANSHLSSTQSNTIARPAHGVGFNVTSVFRRRRTFQRPRCAG